MDSLTDNYTNRDYVFINTEGGGFWIGTRIENWNNSHLDIYSNAPSPAQLYQGYKDNNRIQESFYGNAIFGEITAAVIDYTARPPPGWIVPSGYRYANLIERPTEIKKLNSEWKVSGGNKVSIDLPPSGWISKLEPTTGLPTHTCVSQETNSCEVKNAYFDRDNPQSSLSSVLRLCKWDRELGKYWNISLYYEATNEHTVHIGSRYVFNYNIDDRLLQKNSDFTGCIYSSEIINALINKSTSFSYLQVQ